MPSVSKWAVMVLPSAEAEAPSAINTVAKPSTKAKDSATTRQSGRQPRALSSFVSSSRLMPARKQRYGGTSGKTQGERNDSSPAPSAPIKEMEETTDFPALVDTCEFVYMYHMSGQMLAKTVAAAALSTSVLWPGMAQAAELVMFEQAGCIYCQRWDREVGALYERTDEAKAMPLRRVDIQNQKASGIVLASPVRYTPTFVVVDNGREIGRITGYSNDNAFWGLLDALAAKLRPSSREPNRI